MTKIYLLWEDETHTYRLSSTDGKTDSFTGVLSANKALNENELKALINQRSLTADGGAIIKRCQLEVVHGKINKQGQRVRTTEVKNIHQVGRIQYY